MLRVDLRHFSRVLAVLALIGSLTGNVMAACVEDGQVPEASMACCAAGHMTCGEHLEAMDCCRSQSSVARSDSLASPPQKAANLLIESVEAAPIVHSQVSLLSGASTHLYRASLPSPIHAPPLFVAHHAFLI